MATATTSSSAKGRGKNGKGSGDNGHASAPQPLTSDATTTTTSFGAVQQSASTEEIARRAYELYEQDGRQDGKDVEYWLQAEAELSGRRG